MKFLLLLLLLATIFGTNAYGVNVTKEINAKVYAHIMPWFETSQSSVDGLWGIHWTMANQNPDIVDGNGRRQIAAYYYPEIGPYASGTYETVEYQLLLMKYAGIDGVLIDWPGTTQAWDYQKNLANCEEIIRGAERIGLEISIVYEDHNVGMAFDAGLITDKFGQAQADMIYLRDNYFNKNNYAQVNGRPLLLDFGPQTFQSASDWNTIFSPFGDEKPSFFTLWGQMYQAEGNAIGEYPWIYVNFLLGLSNFYDFSTVEIKFGVAYPGFNSFYAEGGWGGPGWTIPVALDTFSQTLDLAIKADVPWIQLATWNDYGEGTMMEPTLEFGNGFLNLLQQKLGVKYGNKELEVIKDLYAKRMEIKKNGGKNGQILDAAAQLLIDLKAEEAARLLSTF